MRGIIVSDCICEQPNSMSRFHLLASYVPCIFIRETLIFKFKRYTLDYEKENIDRATYISVVEVYPFFITFDKMHDRHSTVIVVSDLYKRSPLVEPKNIRKREVDKKYI